MTRRNILWLAGALLVFGLAAAWRWPDSAHAIGVVKQSSGTARHAVVLQPGPDRYLLVVTAPVLPPWRGDARVAIEGDLAPDFDLSLSAPVVDLALHRWPRLQGRTLLGLAPGDRIALWVRMKAPELDPVCGMKCPESGSLRAGGHCFCSELCRSSYLRQPDRYAGAGYQGQQIRLTLRDGGSGQSLLTVPIRLGGKGSGDAHHH